MSNCSMLEACTLHTLKNRIKLSSKQVFALPGCLACTIFFFVTKDIVVHFVLPTTILVYFVKWLSLSVRASFFCVVHS